MALETAPSTRKALAEDGVAPSMGGGERAEAPAAETSRSASLSPSRAADFMSCPLRYRFRVIDRLEEAPAPAATRGTLVHAVLERLFEAEPAERTRELAETLLAPEWQRLLEEEPGLSVLFEGPDAVELEPWLASAQALLSAYFAMEDPTTLRPEALEIKVSHILDDASDDGEPVELRGIVDRLDVSPAGALRVVDYKTGRAPGEGFESSALFQMKFYALLLLRSRGIMPKELKLLYLNGGESLTYKPEESELDGFERRVKALWQAIRRAEVTGDWRPKRSRLCDWCDHQALCPEFGGTPPPLPVVDTSGAA